MRLLALCAALAFTTAIAACDSATPTGATDRGAPAAITVSEDGLGKGPEGCGPSATGAEGCGGVDAAAAPDSATPDGAAPANP